MGYGLHGRGSFPAGVRDFLHILQTLWGPSSHLSNGYWASFPSVKQPGREADHSLPSGADFKNDLAIYPVPHYVFMVWQLYLMFFWIKFRKWTWIHGEGLVKKLIIKTNSMHMPSFLMANVFIVSELFFHLLNSEESEHRWKQGSILIKSVPKDVGLIFFWNVGNHLQDYLALYPRTPQSEHIL
jgi:hypothetical protein